MSEKTIQGTRKKEYSIVRFYEDPEQNKSSPQVITHGYLPRLHRQKTEIVPATRTEEYMHDLLDVITDDKIEEELAKMESVQIITHLVIFLRKLSGFDFKMAYQIKTFPQFPKIPETVYFVLPFKYEGASINPLDPGYVTLSPAKKLSEHIDKLISYDGIHISPLKFRSYFVEILEKAVKRMDLNRKKKMLEKENLERKPEMTSKPGKEGIVDKRELDESVNEQFTEDAETTENGFGTRIDDKMKKTNSEGEVLDNQSVSNTAHEKDSYIEKSIQTFMCLQGPGFKETELEPPFSIKLPCGWTLELLPAIFTSPKDPVYLMKPYERDENENSDVRWRICYANRESVLLKTIADTDKDFRMVAMEIVISCLKCESRLSILSPYQIQTCLLHDMDFLLDHNPRWQRQSLEKCVRSLMKKIFEFLASGNLPHFFIDNFNLLEYWKESDLKGAQSAMGRLLGNESALINLIKRTTRQKLDDSNSDTFTENTSRTSTCLSQAPNNF